MAMIVIAGLLAIAHPAASFAIPDGAGAALQTLMVAAACFVAASAIAVVPVSMIYFRSSTHRRRTTVLFFFAILGLVASGAVQVGYQIWNGSDLSSAFRGSLPSMFYLGTSTVLFSLGLVVLHGSGFRWGIIAKNSSPIEPIDPLVEQPTLVAKAGSFRKKNRIAAAVTIRHRSQLQSRFRI